MKKAIIYTVTFIAIQLIVSAIGQGLWSIFNKITGTPMSIPVLIATMTFTSIVTIIVFLYLKWAEVSPQYLRSRPWGVFFWCAIAACGAIIPSTWLQEMMPPLPNIIEEEMSMILQNRWGYLTVGILAPLGEELVFRGAVLRALLRWTPRHWMAIAISALLFALIHANPAQMPHAFLIGLLLGWLYYRTDSILPGIVYHWVNNTFAYVFYNLYPDPSLQLSELFGSSRTVYGAVFFSLLILVPALYQLNLRLHKAE